MGSSRIRTPGAALRTARTRARSSAGSGEPALTLSTVNPLSTSRAACAAARTGSVIPIVRAVAAVGAATAPSKR